MFRLLMMDRFISSWRADMLCMNYKSIATYLTSIEDTVIICFESQLTGPLAITTT